MPPLPLPTLHIASIKVPIRINGIIVSEEYFPILPEVGTLNITAADTLDAQLLTGMLDTLPDHVFLLRVEGERYRLVYCNQALLDFVGVFSDPPECGEFLDRIIQDASVYQRVHNNYQKALSSGHCIEYEESTDGLQKAPLAIFDTRISPLTGPTGNARYICGISRNITARREAETMLRHSNETLEAQLAEIQRLQQQLQYDAIRDPLTNLFNRRYLMESLKRELYRARREDYPVTLMMLDVDHFKHLNDEYGHAIGDQVLVTFSSRLLQGMRNEDVICRWGGEEFLIMMPGLSLHDARTRVEAWRREHSPMFIPLDGQRLAIRFSAGLATAPEHGLDPDELINAADAALYFAKAAGRDQLQVFTSTARP